MSNASKTALITGASSGIGYELAKLFAKDNYNLFIVGRDQSTLNERANEFKRDYNVNVTTFVKDLSYYDQTTALCNELSSNGTFIDVLVNDAGQGQYGKFQDTDINRELEIVQLNIGANLILTKHVLKDMVQRNEGKILFLASVASELPGPWQSVYHGTKAFVLSFAEAIRSELKDTNITITALQPGATDTDFFNKAEMQESKMLQDKSSLSNAADVAKDGYDALMAGDDKIISGFKNKVQVGVSHILPASTVADNMNKQQGPVGE
ncbi:SDR family NAD(P)-dependent oxidoreductase [Mucilaginibacter sp.]